MYRSIRLIHITGLVLAVTLAAAVPALAQNQKDVSAIRSVVDQLIKSQNSIEENVIRATLGAFSTTAGTIYLPGGNESVSELRINPTKGLEDVTVRSLKTTSPIRIQAGKTLGWATFTWESERHMANGRHVEAEGRATIVLAKERKTWRITHVHASIPVTRGGGATGEADAEALIDMERSIWEAFRKGDLAPVEDYFSESVTVLGSGSTYRTTGKTDVLASINEFLKKADLSSYQMLDPKVDFHGGSAILTYYYSHSFRVNDEQVNESGKITTIFANEEGTWRVVHHHSTANPESHE